MNTLSENLQAAADTLAQRFGAQPQVAHGELTLITPPGSIVAAARALRDEFNFDMLVDITAADYWPAEQPRFHVIYQFVSTSARELLRLRVPLDGSFPEIESVDGVYRGANWYEREVFDLFGVRFTGSLDMRRIIMPYDWQGHPLRKDYPLGYEEVQFTFNFDEIERRKQRPTL